MNIRELTNKKIGRWTVLELTGINKRDRIEWKCQCDCKDKTIRNVEQVRLLNNTSKSCGCIRKEMLVKRNTKHKLTKTRAYNSWSMMKARCYHKNRDKYERYGGRGIIVCPRWLDKENGFINFLEDMGEPPDKMSLDRIDNNGNYCKENCRWATQSQQLQNTIQNVNITYKGETHCISEWSRILKIKRATIKSRLSSGLSVDDIFKPVQIATITYNGETKCLSQWKKDTGINEKTIISRIKNGWEIKRALTEKPRKRSKNVKSFIQ